MDNLEVAEKQTIKDHWMVINITIKPIFVFGN